MVQITIGILGPVTSLVFGILILMFPKILNYLVGIYLIVIGVVGILAMIL